MVQYFLFQIKIIKINLIKADEDDILMMKMMKTKGDISNNVYPLREDLFKQSTSQQVKPSERELSSQPVIEFGKLEKILSERAPLDKEVSNFYTVHNPSRVNQNNTSYKVIQNRNVTVSILSRSRPKTEIDIDKSPKRTFKVQPVKEPESQSEKNPEEYKDKYKYDFETKKSKDSQPVSSKKVESERSKYSFGANLNERAKVESKRSDTDMGINLNDDDPEDACPRENFSDIVDPSEDNRIQNNTLSRKGDFFLNEDVTNFYFI